MLKISTRAQNVPASPIRKLTPLAEEAKKAGKTLYHLNVGQPDLPSPKEFLDAVHNYPTKTIAYAPAGGVPELVHAWQNFYNDKGWNFYPHDIVVTSGGAEAIIFALLALCDKGDEVLVFEPFYTSYAMFAAMLDITLVPVTTFIETGFHLPTKEQIEKKITSKTKAMLIVNPGNPTGTVYTKEEIDLLAEIAVEKNLFILSDETYQEIVFDGKTVTNFSGYEELRDYVVIVDSLSKRLNVCGARLGCVASYNMDIMKAILLFAQSRLSAGVIEQTAIAPFFLKSEDYIKEITAEYARRRDVVVEGLSAIEGATFKAPEGAFYVIVGLPVDDADAFAKYLLTDFHDNNETVMVAPAGGFYATPGLGKKEIRIAYVLEQQKLKRAMELLKLAVEKYNSKSTA